MQVSSTAFNRRTIAPTSFGVHKPKPRDYSDSPYPRLDDVIDLLKTSGKIEHPIDSEDLFPMPNGAYLYAPVKKLVQEANAPLPDAPDHAPPVLARLLPDANALIRGLLRVSQGTKTPSEVKGHAWRWHTVDVGEPLGIEYIKQTPAGDADSVATMEVIPKMPDDRQPRHFFHIKRGEDGLPTKHLSVFGWLTGHVDDKPVVALRNLVPGRFALRHGDLTHPKCPANIDGLYVAIPSPTKV